jgi:menaquinone-9 beta-reductase
MHSCDVLIIGGGPAGSSCAWGLRQSGLSVAILDKQEFPRDKVCGGWITPRVPAALELDLAEYARARVLQPLTGFRVGSIGGSAVETNYGASVSFGIRRGEFDDYLLRRSGARLLLGEALKKLERSADGWIANGQVHARLVVGAGGHFCPVARLKGAKSSGEAAVVAQEVEFAMDANQRAQCRVRGEVPELYFCRDMKGYGWCFRKGDYLNVGLGRADPHQLSAHVAGFMRFLKAQGRVGFDVPPLHGHAYLLQGTSTRSLVADGVLLIGDSAGLAYPQSGEGIWPAVESGLLAAKTIAAADGDYQQNKLEAYSADLAAAQGSAARNLGQYLPSWLAGLLGRNLLRTHWFVRGVVLDKWFLSGSAQAGVSVA